MDNGTREVRREINKDMAEVQSEFRSFMIRVCAVANLLVPGLGYLLLGRGLIKGIISFVLYVGYGLFFFLYLMPLTDLWWLYGLPLPIISIASTCILAGE